MKKVKIMLASIAILAVVGGALAFNANCPFKVCYAKNFYVKADGSRTCTTIPAVGQAVTTQACTSERLNSTGEEVGNEICYTTVLANQNCPALCTFLGRSTLVCDE